MTTFAVEALGCKVSLVDAHDVRERLLADGHVEAPADEAAVRVVNTCCVTAEAVAKSRKAVRRAARGADAVYVTGCAANLRADAFAGAGAGVRVIARRAEETPGDVARDLGALACTGATEAPFARTRAYVKIQDGCSFSCSYCVIPLVRGESRSRSAERVLAEAARRARQGHRELVLTGINLGCFRDRAAGYDLPRLLAAAADVPGVERVRLSSIEVNHLTDRLVDVLAGHPRVATHLHVPMQAGDDAVLAAMHRRYSAAAFLRKVARARERAPALNVTSDVIVGHPAEGEAAFGHTLAAVAAAGFTRVHVFPYSPRPGTRDAGADDVTPAAKRDRSARLRALSERLGAAHRAGKVGCRERVLVETADGRGYSDDYTPFVVEDAAPGTLASVLATGLAGGAVRARVVDQR